MIYLVTIMNFQAVELGSPRGKPTYPVSSKCSSVAKSSKNERLFIITYSLLPETSLNTEHFDDF